MDQRNKLSALDSDYEIVFAIIRKALFGGELSFPAEVDYEAIFDELQCQAILPLSINIYKDLPISDELASRWKAAIYQKVLNGLQVQNVEQITSALLFENGIESAILKGSSAAMYYPSDYMRTFGDVDIIVSPDNFEKAAELLLSNGFKQITGLYDDYRNVTLSYCNVRIELHRHFFGERESEFDCIVYDSLKRCKKKVKEEQYFFVLPDLENGLILLQHIRQHIVGALGLRQIIDWVMFVSKACDDSFWNNLFRERANALGLETLALVATKLGKMYFGLSKSITWCDPASNEAVEAMLSYLIDNGNFGVKCPGPKVVLNIVGRNRNFIEWFKYFQYTGESNWEYLKKHPTLKRFAWLYQIIRYIYKGIVSGEVLNYFQKKLWKEAKQKRNLYSMLDIE